jgi:hemerythrin-like domain-containing protein
MQRDRSLVPLSHQHHNVLALCVLTERSLLKHSSPGNVAKLARRIIDLYDIEIVNHFQIEEQILFPELVKRTGDGRMVAVLCSEHRAIESMIGDLRADPSENLIGQFIALMRPHIRQEEDKLFQEVQKVVPRDALDALGREIEAKAVRVCL